MRTEDKIIEEILDSDLSDEECLEEIRRYCEDVNSQSALTPPANGVWGRGDYGDLLFTQVGEKYIKDDPYGFAAAVIADTLEMVLGDGMNGAMSQEEHRNLDAIALFTTHVLDQSVEPQPG